jgi:hypothetical protein
VLETGGALDDEELAQRRARFKGLCYRNRTLNEKGALPVAG